MVGLFGVAGEPGALEGVAEEAEARAGELLGDAHVALHVHECDGEEGAVFFEAADHAFLALGGEEEALGSDFGDGGDGAFDLFFSDELELAVCFGAVGLGDDVDDVEDVDAALRREILAADQGRSDGDEFAALVGMFGDFEAHCLDARDGFCGIEHVPGIQRLENVSQSPSLSNLRINDSPGLVVK